MQILVITTGRHQDLTQNYLSTSPNGFDSLQLPLASEHGVKQVWPHKYLSEDLVLTLTTESVRELAKSCPGAALNKLVAYMQRMNDLTPTAQ